MEPSREPPDGVVGLGISLCHSISVLVSLGYRHRYEKLKTTTFATYRDITCSYVGLSIAQRSGHFDIGFDEFRTYRSMF